MGGFMPIPPSSAYCVQRSDSISSAAARNRRMATSPWLRDRLPDCARAKVAFANKPAPTAAPPARRLLFMKERRSTERLMDERSSSFFIIMFHFLFACDFVSRYCGLDAATKRRDADRMSFDCQLFVSTR